VAGENRLENRRIQNCPIQYSPSDGRQQHFVCCCMHTLPFPALLLWQDIIFVEVHPLTCSHVHEPHHYQCCLSGVEGIASYFMKLPKWNNRWSELNPANQVKRPAYVVTVQINHSITKPQDCCHQTTTLPSNSYYIQNVVTK
jgi:hypothetical protein